MTITNKSTNINHEARNKQSLEAMAKKAHEKIRDDARNYFKEHGINDSNIDKFMLGSGDFDEYHRLTIPIFNRDGKIAYIKLWATPDYEEVKNMAEMMHQEVTIPEYAFYPTDVEPILIGEDQLIKSTSSDVLICESELDRIVAIQEGIKIPVVAKGGGVQIFKDEWIELLKNMRNIYVCMNDDETSKKLAQHISEHTPAASVYEISLPHEDNAATSLTNYFIEKRGTADELLSKYAKFYCGAKPIDASQFKEISVEDIASVLDSTIKYDFTNKVITFLAMLLTYTESDQQNIMFNADSSTGKTYICQEVSKYFPQQDVKKYATITPTAFFYSQSLREKDKETGQDFINLERRILIFTEQPDTQLQEKLRPLLSHDSKRIPFAITNKGSGGKNVAMEGYILGFSSAFFCSANMRIDEQEQTRCMILSPENTPEKIMAGIDASIARNSHKDIYDARISNNKNRRELMERILYIKSLKIDAIDINDSEYLKFKFMENRDALLPKVQREISHFISLVKAIALVNAPFRMKDGKIVAINKDIDEAAKLWAPLRESMSHGVSPQVLNFYKRYIIPIYRLKNKNATAETEGVTYDEIRKGYYSQTGSYPNMENVRKQYIPALRTASLIRCDKDKNDKRRINITPLEFFDDLENN